MCVKANRRRCNSQPLASSLHEHHCVPTCVQKGSFVLFGLAVVCKLARESEREREREREFQSCRSVCETPADIKSLVRKFKFRVVRRSRFNIGSKNQSPEVRNIIWNNLKNIPKPLWTLHRSTQTGLGWVTQNPRATLH